MSASSYRDILMEMYFAIPEFRSYVDHWCMVTSLGKHHAFENADVQRKCIAIMNSREKFPL